MGEHGYGTDSDCTCGRNFQTVRGLREHLTKARAQTTVIACQTPRNCTCGAPETTPRGMHHDYCAVRGGDA